MKNKAASVMGLIAVALSASAQVVVDNSFGTGTVLLGPNFKIPAEVGKSVGANLFHSFTEFSLQTGHSATFTGPDVVQNILGRVTGGNISEIDGLIKSEIADANLYLLNPAGFLFGENAKVDVDGALVVSTRESIKLGEEGSFNAVNPDQSVFIAAAPEAFGFLGENPAGKIKIEGSNLNLKTPLSMVGGDVVINQSLLEAEEVKVEAESIDMRESRMVGIKRMELEASGGITIAKPMQNQHVEATTVSGKYSSILLPLKKGLLEFGAESEETPSTTKGSIVSPELQITAKKLSLESGAAISASRSSKGYGGRVAVKAGEIAIGKSLFSGNAPGFTGIRSIYPGTMASEGIGSVTIDADKLDIAAGAGIVTDNSTGQLSKGYAGNIVLNVKEINIDGTDSQWDFTGIRSNNFYGCRDFLNTGRLFANRSDSGGGNITVEAESITILGKGGIVADSYATGPGGNIKVNTDTITIDGKKQGFYNLMGFNGILTGNYVKGDAGKIDVEAKNIKIFEAGSIGSSSYFAYGKTGPVSIKTETLMIDGGKHRVTTGVTSMTWFSSAPWWPIPSESSANNIVIDAGDITVLEGGKIISSCSSVKGDSGNITVNANNIYMENTMDDFDWANGFATTVRYVNGTGHGGNIVIEAETITGKESMITSETFGQDYSGDISITAKNIYLESKIHENSRTGIVSNSINTDQGGDAGHINIVADDIELAEGGKIESNTWGSGDAGRINIKTKNLTINDENGQTPTGISTESMGGAEGGDAGDISIETDKLQMVGGQVSSETSGFGHAGNVVIKGVELNMTGRPLSENTSNETMGKGITTASLSKNLGGDAGDINIQMDSTDMGSGSRVSSFSHGMGNGGSITIKAKSLEMDDGNRKWDTWVNVASHNEENGGDAGDIVIESESLKILNGASVGAQTRGKGNAGVIHLHSNLAIIDGVDSRVSTNTRNALVGGDAGEVTIYADKLLMMNQGEISSKTDGRGNAGSVTIQSDTIQVHEGQVITASNGREMESGNAGSIAMQANTIDILEGSNVSSETRGGGDGGEVKFKGDNLTIDGKGKITKVSTESSLNENGGAGGQILIEASLLNVINGGIVSTSTLGDGQAGQVTLKVDNLKMDGQGEPTSIESASEGAGAGGQVVIDAVRVELLSGGQISTSTRSHGQGGVVQLTAGQLTVDGQSGGVLTGIASETSGSGNAGQVNITVPEVRVLSGGEINTSTSGAGQAGDLLVKADRLMVYSGGLVVVEAHAQGDAGQMTIRANDVEVTSGGSLSASTHGSGRGGNVDLATELLLVSGKGRIQSASAGTGNSGRVSVEAKRIEMNTAGSITTEALKSSGGEIELKAYESFQMEGAIITAQARKDGGSVTVNTPADLWLVDSMITAEAGQDGGNILVESPVTTVLQRSRLSANAIYGHGGYILIVTEGFLPSTESTVTASSEFGVQGTVEIRTPDSDVGSGLVVLASTLTTEEINLADRCALQLQSRDKSSFVKWGYGGVPTLADQLYLPTAHFRFSALSGNAEEQE